MLSQTEEIKSRVDIVDLIQSYIKLDKAGINYKAVCPFHSEKTPSFFVTPSRQRWHCFGGCSEGGDIFTFVQKIEGVDFPEALEILAKRAGIQLTREDPKLSSERKRLYDICEVATKYFEKQFKENGAVEKYMKDRGVSDETLRSFRVGFAPDGWRNLMAHLLEKGFRAEDAERAGLAIKIQNQSRSSQSQNPFYDRFRGRIIFPIADGTGRIIGFGGRIFEAGTKQNSAVSTEAKYINSPQTPIYDKSRVLYAFDKAKQEIRKQNVCILVEGYMDTIMSHQAGFTNTVAVSGTALTEPQLQMLKRLTNTVISSFDGDSAGQSATSRSLDLAGAYDFERKIAAIPTSLGKDPADVVLKGVEEWKKILESAKNVVEFYFDKALAENNVNEPAGKKAIAAGVLPQLVLLSNEIERSYWMRKLAGVLGVPESAVWQEFQKISVDGFERETMPVFDDTRNKKKQPTRREDTEEKLLGILLLYPAKLSLLEGRELDPSYFTGEKTAAAFSFLSGRHTGDPMYHDHLKFKTEVFLEDIIRKDGDIDKEILICFNEFLRESIKERLGDLSRRIIEAERGGSEEALAGLMQEFQILSGKLHALS
ncbi:MAG: DNA primase [Candidatus Sungbacteria bacterium RIFCSPHIGHO2_01_FULL_47_32]|uniref:DNA primase n=1 Tax=Candidatus Sungbacteria bacterium RIFCSPHIGHO2_01_FULL_47_32 TaxID=1802264 RepID=A0A1G2K8J1_9BACT|nr:MAG: DNA primase [Candidatus Sungbacteria bacterium RIFCSPHIGHO2_01_FULL_47_32]